jgi:23S rRNA (adenine2503-C2)-methyltransferase
MEITTLPTGLLFTDQYSKGKLETLSIGDYGKGNNIKADFLGYTNEINGVENGVCMPLSEKWVVTLSTQYGCSCDCTFCDVPKIDNLGNASFDDLKQQLYSAIAMFPNVKYTNRLNIHFARMGEPAFNREVLRFSDWMVKNKHKIKEDTGLAIETLHPVFTTMAPKRIRRMEDILLHWTQDIKNGLYNGQAGLQLSINSTDEAQRDVMFKGLQLTLEKLSEICQNLPHPIGRKYCLNFAYCEDYEIDGEKLAKLFSPEKFMCKITPIHNNEACRENGIETVGGYESYHPYRKPEESLKAAGFDVLIFIPSMDEEDGLVTCGNLVLSGTEVKTNAIEVKILGQ